jgi:O-antigen ligase
MRTDFIVDNPKVAHNTYLNVLAELGIVGFFLLLVIIALPLRCAAQAIGFAARAGDRQLEVLARAMVVVIVGLLAADFFGSRQYSKQLWLVLSLGPVLLQVSRAQLASRHAEGAAAGRSLSAPPA